MKGWHFVKGVDHYWVGAPDAEAAKRALREHDFRGVAETEPVAIPSAVVDFFKLRPDMVITGRVFL